jgi:PAS domain S-box-containing protein
VVIEDVGRFRAIIQPLALPVAAVDLNGRLIVFSDGFDRFARQFGVAPSLGREVTDCFPTAPAREHDIRMLERALAGETATTFTWRYLDPVGRRAVVRTYSPMLRDGVVVGAFITIAEAVEAELEGIGEVARERLDEVLDALPIGVAIGDARGRFLYSNPAAKPIIGDLAAAVAAGDYDDVEVRDLRSGEPIAPSERPIARALRLRARSQGDIQFRTPGGEMRFLRESAAPLGREGAVEGFVATGEDITERVVAGRTSRARDARLRRLFENMDEAFVVLRAIRGAAGNALDFEVLESNQAVSEFSGRSPEEMAGARFIELLADVGISTSGFLAGASAVASGEARTFARSYWLPTATGRRFMEVRIFPLGDDVVGVLGSDRTDIQLSMEQAAASEERFRSLFDHMGEAYVMCRGVFEGDELVDWTYLAANEVHERLVGRRAIVGHRVSELWPGLRDSDPELFALCGRVALSGVPARELAHVRAADRWFESSIFSPKKGYFAAVFSDVTERVRAEESDGGCEPASP